MTTEVSRRSIFQAGVSAAAAQLASAIPQQSVTVNRPPRSALPAEADVETARAWWPPERNVWTPVGWKDHYFRFNVVYNGTIICEPCPHFAPVRPHALRWKGQSFQLTFAPTEDGMPLPLPQKPAQLWRLDGGHGLQGWGAGHATPVLWTEWRLNEGVIVRQEIFSHIQGGQQVESGIEPHYAWIRLAVTHVDELRAPDQLNFSVQLSQVFYKHAETYKWEDGITIDVDPEIVPYASTLHADPFNEDAKTGLRLTEPDGKVRLIVMPHLQQKVVFSEIHPEAHIYNLKVRLDSKVGDSIDLLVPMLPDLAADIEAERRLGRESALAESDRFWSPAPATAARVDVPEPYINEVIVQSIKLAEVIAEKDYINGDHTFLTGSWGYDNLWSTPTSMTTFMFLDLLGYFDTVSRHVELFRKHQGSVKPPGPTYQPHPGYFSTPRTLTAFDWLTDHGAILHQVSTHALLSNDDEFIRNWQEPILKGCDFIKDVSAQTNHDGVKGLMPPAVATDDIIPTQAVYSLAWNYKGLCSAVRFLNRIRDPRAAEMQDFANRFKSIFVDAFREKSEKEPRWTDSNGQKRYKPPTTLSTKPMPFHPFSDAFYLDGGPMVLVWAGLMEARDPLMRDCAGFFREGPDASLYWMRSNPLSRPVLIHEISSCEPCYSWNIFHSRQLGDRARFLEGLYSLLLGATSTQTYSACEHRHGIQSCQCPTYLAFNLARLAVIDDELVEGELHLLRLCPTAWITPHKESVFEKMPTLYGTVDLRWRLTADGAALQISFRSTWREKPRKIKLHLPPGVASVVINGRRQAARPVIELQVI